MRNEVVNTFENELFGSLYVFTDNNGAPWFVGKQVAEKLGFSVANTAGTAITLSRHCPDKKQVSVLEGTLNETFSVLPQGVRRNSALISEADLYRLVMNSTLESAVAFQDWVVREVLPSVRQHGGYNVEQPTMAAQYADPELFQRMNNMHQEFGEFIRSQTSFNTQILGTLGELVRVIATGPAEAPLRPMTEGHVTLDELYSLVNGVVSKDAFKSMLRGARWPRSSYERRLECGRVVELTSFPVTAEVLSQEIHINQLMDRVVRESRQITVYFYEHQFIAGRFRINR